MHGGIMVMSLIAAIFFFKFWSKTGDRFFGIFALAFVLFGIERCLLAVIDPTNEVQPFVYSFRMLSFLMIIWAVIDKNRKVT